MTFECDGPVAGGRPAPAFGHGPSEFKPATQAQTSPWRNGRQPPLCRVLQRMAAWEKLDRQVWVGC